MSFARQLLLADVAYSAWANQCLLDGCSAFTAEELERDLSTSHSSILATLRHFYDGERIWLPCLRDTPDGDPSCRVPHSFAHFAHEWVSAPSNVLKSQSNSILVVILTT